MHPHVHPPKKHGKVPARRLRCLYSAESALFYECLLYGADTVIVVLNVARCTLGFDMVYKEPK